MSAPLRVAIIEPLANWVRDLYQAELEAVGFAVHWAGDAEGSSVLDATGGADVIVTGQRRITAAMIETAGAALRLLQVQGRAPWAVNLEAAGRAGVPVSFMPHRGAIAVAEHTLALALGLYRKLVPGHLQSVAAAYRQLGIEPVPTDERTIAFNWMRFDGVRQLRGRTMGLVGLGDIGLEVARRALAFDMKVIYFRRDPVPAEYEAPLRIRYSQLEDLLREADIISLHAPHTAATEGMIGAAALARMKPDAVLINTSRGGLVDEAALAECLREGRIGGAGLDVFRDEPLPAGHPFTGLDNVLLSPHLGGGTGGGQKGLVGDIVANIQRVAAGTAAEHLVDVPGAGPWP